MRTLLMTGVKPWEPFGGAMRTRMTAEALAAHGPVDLLVLTLDGDTEVPADQRVYDRILPVGQRYTHFDPTRNLGRRLCELAGGTLGAQVHGTRRAVVEQASDWLRAVSYDLVWYTRELIWLMTRDLVQAPSVIDVDGLRDTLLKQWLDIGKADRGAELTLARRIDAVRVIRRWQRIHRKAGHGADVLVYASESDRRRFDHPRSVVVPNTYAGPDQLPARPPRCTRRPTILFQGVLSYGPNTDAATWLVEDIAPLVRAEIPNLRVLLVGQSSKQIDRLGHHSGVDVTGVVPDMTPYLDQSDLLVAPLRIGSGTRIKILEAFAHGLPVVSTTIGAEGIEAVAGTHLHLADTTGDIARRCLELLRDPVSAEAVAHQAYRLFDARYRPARAVERIDKAVALAMSRQLR